MSSIDASDRSRQTDEIRRIREEYDNKTGENSKKTSRDMRAQSTKHQKDIEALKNEYERQIAEMRNKNAELMNSRDQKHQSEIENIRRIFVDSLGRKTTENQQAKDAMEDSFARDSAKEKMIHEQQKSLIQKGYSDSLAEQERNFNQFVESSNQKVRNTIENRTEKIKDKYKQDLTATQADRDLKVSNLSRSLDETQKESMRTKTESEVRQASKLRDKDAHWQNVLRNQEHEFTSELDGANRQLQAHTRWMSEDNKNRMDQKMQDIEESNNNFREVAAGRIENEVRGAKADAAQARNDRLIDMIANRRIRNLEKGDLVQQYEGRMAAYEKEKEQIQQVAMDGVNKRIDEQNHQVSRLIMDVNRDAKMKQNIAKQQNKETVADLVYSHKSELDHVNDRADERVKKIMKLSAGDSRVQTMYHEQNIDALKGKYMENLENQREAHLNQLKDVYVRMEKRLRDTETNLQSRLDNTTAFYEEKISKMDEDGRNKINELNKDFDIKTKNREKAVKMEMETLAQKYEGRIAQAEELQRKELDRQEKRHQEQLAAVTARAAANTKKA